MEMTDFQRIGILESPFKNGEEVKSSMGGTGTVQGKRRVYPKLAWNVWVQPRQTVLALQDSTEPQRSHCALGREEGHRR